MLIGKRDAARHEQAPSVRTRRPDLSRARDDNCDDGRNAARVVVRADKRRSI